jgi:hypothetical protein
VRCRRDGQDVFRIDPVRKGRQGNHKCPKDSGFVSGGDSIPRLEGEQDPCEFGFLFVPPTLPSIQAEIDKHIPSLSSSVAVIVNEEDWQVFLDSHCEKVRETRRRDTRVLRVALFSYPQPILIVGKSRRRVEQSTPADHHPHTAFELLQRCGKTNGQREKGTVNLSHFQAFRLIVDECKSEWSGPRSVRISLCAFARFQTVQHLRAPRTWLAKICIDYADQSHVKHVLLLSGTPAPSNVSDLYVPLRLINVGFHRPADVSVLTLILTPSRSQIIPANRPFGPWAKRTRRGRYEQAEGLKRELDGSFYTSRTFDFAKEMNIEGRALKERDQTCAPSGREKEICECSLCSPPSPHV